MFIVSIIVLSLSGWKKRHDILVYPFQRDYIIVFSMSEILYRWESLEKNMQFDYLGAFINKNDFSLEK